MLRARRSFSPRTERRAVFYDGHNGITAPDLFNGNQSVGATPVARQRLSVHHIDSR